ncbi:rhomboid-like protein [Streptacidiphilus sp. EB129]|uniref:rhomboid-like protein n=1 Tax=Streptacidiphilus sp. EB129 TaxID=3156262 RepID=UPI003515026B
MSAPPAQQPPHQPGKGPQHRSQSRLRRAGGAVAHYVRRAPGTYVWLAALLLTTVVINHINPEFQDQFLRQRSTNLHQLATRPVRVLFASAFWLDGGGWLGYFVLYNLFQVPAERWLGTRRWLGVLVVSHVGATYLSEGALYWAIRHGHAPLSAVNTLDVGVSYALAGVQAVLAYRIAYPWRLPYLAVVLLWYGLALVHGRTFTDVGHLTAALLGLACHPLTRGRGEPWSPTPWLRSLRPRRRSADH